MEVEFRNVTITIANADSPKQAYDLLCEMLGAEHLHAVCAEWSTDTYVVYPVDGAASQTMEEHSTSELFPAES